MSFPFFLERGRLAGMKARRPCCLVWPELHDRRAKLGLAEVDFRKRAPDHDFGHVLDVGRQNDFLLVVGADERFGLELVEQIDVAVGIHDRQCGSGVSGTTKSSDSVRTLLPSLMLWVTVPLLAFGP